MCALDSFASGVVRESFWFTLATIINSVLGFLFWLLAALLTDAIEVGYATTGLSIAMLASTSLTLGLHYAALKDIPIGGHRAFSSTLLLTILLASVASVTALSAKELFTGFDIYSYVTAAITFFAAIGVTSSYALVALALSKQYAYSQAAASVTRLTTLPLLVYLGLKGLGVELAYLTHFITFTTLTLIFASRRLKVTKPNTSDLERSLKIGLANYPLTLPSIVLSSGIVTFALTSAEPAQVGALYISLMLSSVVGAVIHGVSVTSLPAMVKDDDVTRTPTMLRWGLAAATPLVAILLAAPNEILSLIGRDFAANPSTLRLAALSVPSAGALMLTISRLNAESKLLRICVAGIVQLATIVLLTTPLAALWSSSGAAFAYLLSTLTPLPLVLKRGEVSPLVKSLAALTFTFVLLQLITLPSMLRIIITLIASISIVFAVKLITAREVLIILRTVVSTF